MAVSLCSGRPWGWRVHQVHCKRGNFAAQVVQPRWQEGQGEEGQGRAIRQLDKFKMWDAYRQRVPFCAWIVQITVCSPDVYCCWLSTMDMVPWRLYSMIGLIDFMSWSVALCISVMIKKSKVAVNVIERDLKKEENYSCKHIFKANTRTAIVPHILLEFA